jgi:hypothetical protein
MRRLLKVILSILAIAGMLIVASCQKPELKEAPGYGKEAPGYGEEAPGYGKEAPGYGEEAPGYGK